MVRTRSRRHLFTLGCVSRSLREFTATRWKADQINGRLELFDSVLLLVDYTHSTAKEFIEALQRFDEKECPVGVVPILEERDQKNVIERFLASEQLEIDFEKSRFRLSSNHEANSPNAPPVLNRALFDDQESVAEDLRDSSLLFLQGHAGPFDGSYGRWLTFCSRQLHQDGQPLFSPCCGTSLCFRQAAYDRAETSSEGLIAPSSLRPDLLVADGCGTFVVPGTIYSYQTSLLRAVLQSEAKCAVMSLGVSATCLSIIIVFLAMLARGRTLGQAVREANLHRKDMHSATSLEGQATGSWILVGNPDIRVSGIPITETEGVSDAQAYRVNIDPATISPRAGRLIFLTNTIPASESFGLTCSDNRWASGAVHRDSRAYIWVQGRVSSNSPSFAHKLQIEMASQSDHQIPEWRNRLLWLRATAQWLKAFAAVVHRRGAATTELTQLIDIRNEAAQAIEDWLFSPVHYRPQILVPSSIDLKRKLTASVEQVDLATVLTVAAIVPFAGARLSHLWQPAWIDDACLIQDQRCSCGCVILAHARRHPISNLVRLELSCPACSLLGEVTAQTLGTGRDSKVKPLVEATLDSRVASKGSVIQWFIRDKQRDGSRCTVCATLFDPFRKRRATSEATVVAPNGVCEARITIAEDWPEGLNWTTLVVASMGSISMFAYDIVVRSGRPPQGGVTG